AATQREPSGRPVPGRVQLARHRLHVTVPFEVEGLENEPDGAPAALARFVVGRIPADRLDLSVAVTGVLLGMQLVRRGGAPRKAVVAGELLEHASGRAVGTAVHGFNE